jgi:hypothetical protein
MTATPVTLADFMGSTAIVFFATSPYILAVLKPTAFLTLRPGPQEGTA